MTEIKTEHKSYTMEEMKALAWRDGWEMKEDGEMVEFSTFSMAGEEYTFTAKKDRLEWDIWEAAADYDVGEEVFKEIGKGKCHAGNLKIVLKNKEDILYRLSKLRDSFRPDELT